MKITIQELNQLCADYDDCMGSYPEHEYEGGAVFGYIIDRLAGAIGHNTNGYMSRNVDANKREFQQVCQCGFSTEWVQCAATVMMNHQLAEVGKSKQTSSVMKVNEPDKSCQFCNQSSSSEKWRVLGDRCPDCGQPPHVIDGGY